MPVVISLVAAMAENRVIGRDNRIPWSVPEDLRMFRNLTMGHTVIMGRKTYESIGHQLPGRRVIVLSRNAWYTAPGCVVLPGLPAALEQCCDEEEIFICGGGEIYNQALPLATRIYLTLIHQEVEGDTFFPAIPGEFVLTSREPIAGPIRASFCIYNRRHPA